MTASAPIMATECLEPYCCTCISRYSSSSSTCLVLKSSVVPGIDDHVVLEVDDLLKIAGLHLQQGAEAAWQRLEEPDVHDGRSEVDVAHALAAHAGVRDLHAAAVADDALELRALVLAAGALVVPLGTEDPFAEQAVLLGAVGAVVDRLGLLDLAETPTPDVVGAREGDSRTEVVDADRRRSQPWCASPLLV